MKHLNVLQYTMETWQQHGLQIMMLQSRQAPTFVLLPKPLAATACLILYEKFEDVLKVIRTGEHQWKSSVCVCVCVCACVSNLNMYMVIFV